MKKEHYVILFLALFSLYIYCVRQNTTSQVVSNCESIIKRNSEKIYKMDDEISGVQKASIGNSTTDWNDALTKLQQEYEVVDTCAK